MSSSAYGPEEAFKALGEHTYLAVALAALMAITVLLISAAYRRIIEEFPSGGGGYVVATNLLGPSAGVVSGSALLVDYVLTITISIAAAGDALFSFLPLDWHGWKQPVELGLILGLTTLNIRGVRESVMALLPVFLLFLVTHAVLIGGGIAGAPAGAARDRPRRFGRASADGAATLGLGGLLLLFLRAYSLGGGTYTGIEAVSNGLPIMREPKVETGKRTMVYMGTSLAFTASGLLLCYLLWQVAPVPGKTMNAVLTESLAGGLPFGETFVVRHALLGGGAARGGGAGGLHRRPPGAGQHGGGLLGASPLRRAVRASHHPERHSPDGRGGAGGAGLHQRERGSPGGDVQHQRLSDVLALHAGHAALLAPAPADPARVALAAGALRRGLRSLCSPFWSRPSTRSSRRAAGSPSSSPSPSSVSALSSGDTIAR